MFRVSSKRLIVLCTALMFLFANVGIGFAAAGGSADNSVLIAKSGGGGAKGGSFGGGAKAAPSVAKPPAPSGSGSFGGSSSKPSTAPTTTPDKSAAGSFGGNSQGAQAAKPNQPQQQPSTTTRNYYGGSGSSGGFGWGSFAGGMLLGNLLSSPSHGYASGGGVPGGYSAPNPLWSFLMFILTLVQLLIIAAICWWVGRKVWSWWKGNRDNYKDDAGKFKWK